MIITKVKKDNGEKGFFLNLTGKALFFSNKKHIEEFMKKLCSMNFENQLPQDDLDLCPECGEELNQDQDYSIFYCPECELYLTEQEIKEAHEKHELEHALQVAGM